MLLLLTASHDEQQNHTMKLHEQTAYESCLHSVQVAGRQSSVAGAALHLSQLVSRCSAFQSLLAATSRLAGTRVPRRDWLAQGCLALHLRSRDGP